MCFSRLYKRPFLVYNDPEILPGCDIMTQSEQKSRLMLIGSMAIFGTIGILRKYIPLPSSLIALVRAVVGTLFLLMVLLLKHRKPDTAALKQNWGFLLLSGCALGFNWILLFESYNHTSVATATLCYYLAPILVILASPFLLRETLTVKKILCTGVALVGMVLVSGITDTGFRGVAEMKGILFGLGAALLYACVILLNKKITGIDAHNKTIFQLAVSSVTLLPYVLLTEDVGSMVFPPVVILLLMTAGIIHTGLAYWLYFGSMSGLKGQTVALFSYIDPILAIVLSMVVLREPMSLSAAIGAVMILGAAFVSER